MEYKILSGCDRDVQKILNQWKHTYTLDILGMTATDSCTTILLTRTPKRDLEG